jgi:hypothetical protein
MLAVLRALYDEVRGLRADLRRRVGARALRAALSEEFGDAGFTVSGLLEIVETERDSELARTLCALIDVSAPPRSRATALGRLLASTPGIEVHGEHRGSALYRLADLDE